MNESTHLCSFEISYYDPAEKKWKDYKCNRPAVKDGYCKFHSETYVREHQEEIKEEIKQLVLKERNNSDSKIILMPGFTFPKETNFREIFGSKIQKAIVFNNSKFLGEANFSKITFGDYVTFNKVTFEGIYRFLRSKF